jgi:hypothetical protein
MTSASHRVIKKTCYANCRISFSVLNNKKFSFCGKLDLFGLFEKRPRFSKVAQVINNSLDKTILLSHASRVKPGLDLEGREEWGMFGFTWNFPQRFIKQTMRSKKAIESVVRQFRKIINVIANSCALEEDDIFRLKLLIKEWFRILS